MENFRLESPRLLIVPYDHSYLKDFFTAFTEEITQYQYPDPFPDLERAQEFLTYFLELMERGEMLELVILSKTGEFLGSIEAHGLKEETPELGLWLKAEAHGMGYGYEALTCLMEYLNTTGHFSHYLYEADKRNASSIKLVKKFTNTEASYEELTTESGKQLYLTGYFIQI